MSNKIQPSQSKRLILSLIISLTLACVLAIVPLWASAAQTVNAVNTVPAAKMVCPKTEDRINIGVRKDMAHGWH